MSANLDLVRSIVASWERGDFSSVQWAHPQIEFVIANGPAPGSWTGLDGMEDGFRGWLGAWEDFRVVAKEFRELDAERVLVLHGASGHGRASGVQLGKLPTREACLFHLREGRVTRHVIYYDVERAFADLGLAPEAHSADSWPATCAE